jgi:hypothetical protein
MEEEKEGGRIRKKGKGGGRRRKRKRRISSRRKWHSEKQGNEKQPLPAKNPQSRNKTINRNRLGSDLELVLRKETFKLL